MTGLFIKWASNANLVRELTRSAVAFLVVGGYAVAWHKCRDIERIDDLDLLLDPALENVQKFVDAVSRVDSLTQISAQSVAKHDLHVRIKNHAFYLDVLTPKKDVDFQALLSRSESVTFQNNVTACVISRVDLIEMKRSAIERLKVEAGKHERDLQCLGAV